MIYAGILFVVFSVVLAWGLSYMRKLASPVEKKDEFDFIQKFAAQIQPIEDELVAAGVKAQYEQTGTGDLIDAYKRIAAEEKYEPGHPQYKKTLENTCRLSFIGTILEQRKVARWAYTNDRRTKDDMVQELFDKMDGK
jgi:hypothetical protein